MSNEHCHEHCHDYVTAEQVAQMIEDAQPDLSVVNALVYGIEDYECDGRDDYACGEVVVYKGAFYQSRINDNNRHPHDDKAWQQHGSLTDIFATLSRLQEAAVLAIPYHNSCDMSPVCVPFYNEGDCVAIRVETDELDSCGNLVYRTEYYKSREDKNSDTPDPDVESWDGPYAVCDVFNGVFTPTPPPVNAPTLQKICFKRTSDNINQFGFLQVTDGDLENAVWMLPDGTVIDNTTHIIDPDCVC